MPDRPRFQQKLLLQEEDFYAKKLDAALAQPAPRRAEDASASARFFADQLLENGDPAAFFARRVERCQLEGRKAKTGRKVCWLAAW